MAENRVFRLPDLGEGLPDAEIVQWHKEVGERVLLDEALVSMETAKAVVEVPSPFSGILRRRHGEAGDVIDTGKPLAEIELDDGPQRAEAHDTGHHAPHPEPEPEPTAATAPAAAAAAPTVEPARPAAAAPTRSEAPSRQSGDSGTVVGAMQVGNQVQREQAVAIGGVKAMPATRALARKLGVDLSRVPATGPDGLVTLEDVKRFAANPAPVTRAPAAAFAPPTNFDAPPRVDTVFDQPQPLRGVRRNMARAMAEAHAQVVPATLFDDADLGAWLPGQDLTVRLLRALVAACRCEPALNAHYDPGSGTRTLWRRVDVGLAVDSDDGLFVPALRGAEQLDAAALRAEVERLRSGVRARTLAPEALRDYTLMLSNFGVFAGRYATPVITPPCVAILGAGRCYHAAVPVLGGFQAHRMLPLSLTFDHRACTGGEASRFLAALVRDLQAAC